MAKYSYKLKNSASKEQAGTKPVDTSAKYVRQLEDELLKFKIGNAYLKEAWKLNAAQLKFHRSQLKIK